MFKYILNKIKKGADKIGSLILYRVKDPERRENGHFSWRSPLSLWFYYTLFWEDGINNFLGLNNNQLYRGFFTYFGEFIL